MILENQEVVADQVIIAAGYAPNNSFIGELNQEFKNIQTIGDVNQARRIIDATEEGFLAASQIWYKKRMARSGGYSFFYFSYQGCVRVLG